MPINSLINLFLFLPNYWPAWCLQARSAAVSDASCSGVRELANLHSAKLHRPDSWQHAMTSSVLIMAMYSLPIIPAFPLETLGISAANWSFQLNFIAAFFYGALISNGQLDITNESFRWDTRKELSPILVADAWKALADTLQMLQKCLGSGIWAAIIINASLDQRRSVGWGKSKVPDLIPCLARHHCFIHTCIHFSPYVDCTGRLAQHSSTWRFFYSVLRALRAVGTSPCFRPTGGASVRHAFISDDGLLHSTSSYR